MTALIDSIGDIADRFDAVVLDQWGVLHNGATPYPGAVDALHALRAAGTRLAVLSNSGKRADLNTARIAEKGFAPELFDCVMTSGEALWRDAAEGKLPGRTGFAITAKPQDAMIWAKGLDLTFTDQLDKADFALIMGLPEGEEAPSAAKLAALESGLLQRGLPVFCSNPDRASPRAGGAQVVSPGALAHAIADAGGDVTFFGKPHLPVFRAVEAAMQVAPDRCLMVGDSLEHDIAGGHAAGWSTAFIRGGLYADTFATSDIAAALQTLVSEQKRPTPSYSLATLR